MDKNSLSHTTWNCKYHIVFAPKYFGAYHRFSRARIKDMESYRVRAIFGNPGPWHPTIFLNNELLRKHHITYDEQLVYAQDYGLFVELCQYGEIRILKDALLRYRVHEKQVSTQHREKQIQCDKRTTKKLLLELLGEITEEELDLHNLYSVGYFKNLTSVTPEMLNWFQRLIDANNRTGKYDKKKLKRRVDIIIAQTISRELNISTVHRFFKLFRYVPLPIALETAAKMTVKSILYSQK